jgi:hypothetical protein
MTRRLGSAVVLLALGTLSGCASWCNRNYPCAQPVAYAPPSGCCCPAPAAAVPAYSQPAAYAPTWQAPTGCTCPPSR